MDRSERLAYEAVVIYAKKRWSDQLAQSTPSGGDTVRRPQQTMLPSGFNSHECRAPTLTAVKLSAIEALGLTVEARPSINAYGQALRQAGVLEQAGHQRYHTDGGCSQRRRPWAPRSAQPRAGEFDGAAREPLPRPAGSGRRAVELNPTRVLDGPAHEVATERVEDDRAVGIALSGLGGSVTLNTYG